MNLRAKKYVVRWFQNYNHDYQACNCGIYDRMAKITTEGEQIILSCPQCKFSNMIHPMLFLMMWRAFRAESKNENKVLHKMFGYGVLAYFGLLATLGTTAITSMNRLGDTILWGCLFSLTIFFWSTYKMIKFASLFEEFRVESMRKRRTSR